MRGFKNEIYKGICTLCLGEKICQTYVVDVFRNWKMNGVAVDVLLCKKIQGCTDSVLVTVPRGVFGEI
jgi:hypothetical protein